MHNFEEICADEQNLLRGGNNASEEIQFGVMIGEVEVWGTRGSGSASNWGGLLPMSYYYLFNNGYSTNCGSDQVPNYGGGSSGNSGYVAPVVTGSPISQLASLILANPNVKLALSHMSEVPDEANAKQNIADAANGLQVQTSCYGNAPCTMVSISPSLLNGIGTLAQGFKFSISEIAGGDHSANSTHYMGNTMDINVVNNQHVDILSMSNRDIIAFREAAYAAGATKVLDPLNEPKKHYNHFHIEW